MTVTPRTYRDLWQGPEQEVRESRTSGFYAQPQKFETITVTINLVPRARAHLRSAGSKCHGLWDNQKPDATF